MKFKEPTQATEWLSPALLLSPAELAAELATARNAPALARHALHIELAEAELAALESPRPQAARFALFVHDSGLPVVLLVVQCAALQYRFLVPLLGARQCDWIRECVREASVLLSVDAPQTKQFALVNVLLNLRDDGPLLLRHCESAAQPTRDELVSVMATLVGALQPPHRVTSLVSGIAVARARVFVTLPVAGDVPPHGAGVLAPGSLH